MQTDATIAISMKFLVRRWDSFTVEKKRQLFLARGERRILGLISFISKRVHMLNHNS